ncbi:hypothetical protein ACFOW1_16735 [Parasediminibacterium paludis]|uniref:Uncharacterized protein n=1 Tax=Parasediminibacterium paludis TaxID=908966 RepID=A0ABV8Q1W8_9BACT
MSLQLYIYLVVVSVSFLLNLLLFFKKSTPKYLKGFTPFLFLSLLVEVAAGWLIKKNSSTTLIYNISTTIEITFYLWVLYNITRGSISKKILLISTAVYPIISFVDIIFIQGKEDFHSVGYAFGCLLIVFFTILFFYELFAKPKAIILTREPDFWICTGLLLFYSVTFPFYAAANLMKSFPPILANNVQYLLIVVNVFLYLLFSIAFLCRIKIKKS